MVGNTANAVRNGLMVVLIIFLIYNLIKFLIQLIQMGGNSYGINYMSELW